MNKEREFDAIFSALLIQDEDRRNKLYNDDDGKEWKSAKGKLTIGIGHNIEDNGLSDRVIDLIFSEDKQLTLNTCRRIFPRWNDFTVNRMAAIASMVFNLGETRFRGFRKMIAAVNAGDWQSAAIEVLDSDAARKLPKRYWNLMIMLRGDYDV